MKNNIYLGIDTSNYTTSAALYGGVCFNGKKLLPVAGGQIGLRQSDAVFHHTKQLPPLVEEVFKRLDGRKIAAVGVSNAPREAEGSYMPCFLVGLSAATMLSAALNVPLFTFSHQQGHIAAALYSAGRLDLLDRDFIAFHLSGGTTEALLVKGDGVPHCTQIAGSLDLKAGQAVDRVGVMLGLPFPAGRGLDALARRCEKTFKIRPCLKGADMSLSGIQNQCEKMLHDGAPKEDIAAFCVESIAVSVEACAQKLLESHGNLPLVFSGGVSSNSTLRERLKFGAIFAQPEFSADNAFGAAVLAAAIHGSRNGES